MYQSCCCQCSSLCFLRLQGTVLCDIILLNFLKGAEQYKAKKFEEVIVVIVIFRQLNALGHLISERSNKFAQNI